MSFSLTSGPERKKYVQEMDLPAAQITLVMKEFFLKIIYGGPRNSRFNEHYLLRSE